MYVLLQSGVGTTMSVYTHLEYTYSLSRVEYSTYGMYSMCILEVCGGWQHLYVIHLY